MNAYRTKQDRTFKSHFNYSKGIWVFGPSNHYTGGDFYLSNDNEPTPSIHTLDAMLKMVVDGIVYETTDALEDEGL